MCEISQDSKHRWRRRDYYDLYFFYLSNIRCDNKWQKRDCYFYQKDLHNEKIEDKSFFNNDILDSKQININVWDVMHWYDTNT